MRYQHTLLTLLFLFFLGVGWILFTPSGARAALRWLNHHALSNWEIGQVSGRLVGPLTLSAVRGEQPGYEILVDKITLNWNPLPLLIGRVWIRSLSVEHPRVIIKPATAALTNSFTRSEKSPRTFPMDVKIQSLSVSALQVEFPEKKSFLINHLQVSGQIDSQGFHLIGEGHIAALHNLQSHFFLQGSPEDYEWEWQLANEATAWQLKGTGNTEFIRWHTTQERFLDGSLTASGEYQWGLATGDATVTLTGAQLSALHHSLSGDINAHFQAHFSPENWAFSCDHLEGTFMKTAFTGNGQVQGKNTTSLQAADLLLQLGPSTIETHFRWDQNQYDWLWDLKDLSLFSSRLEGTLYSKGRLNQDTLSNSVFKVEHLAVDHQEVADAFSLEANGSLANHHVNLEWVRNQHVWATQWEGHVFLSQSDEGLSGDWTLAFPKQPPLHLSWILPHLTHYQWPSADQEIQGKLIWPRHELQINQWNDVVQHVSGEIALDLQGSGTWSHPSVEGSLTIKNGQVQWLAPHLSLSQLTTSLVAKNDHWEVDGHVSSGSGELQWSGTFQPGKAGLEGEIKVSGKNFLAYDTPSLRLTSTPALKATLQGKKLDMSGDILIPTAELKFQDFSSTTTLPSDIIFTEGTNKALPPLLNPDQSPLQIYSHINIRLGDQVHLNTHGVQGLLTGQLQLMTDPEHPLLTTGQLQIQEGSYTAYAQNLKIDSGSLNFTHASIDQPWLSLKASRQVALSGTESCLSDDCTLQQNSVITVGVRLEGPLDHLKRSYFSDPAGSLTQARILSYLVLGFDVNQPAFSTNNAYSKQAMIAALYSLNNEDGQGLHSLMENFRQRLNLTEFALGASSNPYSTEGYAESTSLRLGKQLSNKLYINWSLGIDDPIQIVTIRYRFGRHWSIQTEAAYRSSGTGSESTVGGGDLVFHF